MGSEIAFKLNVVWITWSEHLHDRCVKQEYRSLFRNANLWLFFFNGDTKRVFIVIVVVIRVGDSSSVWTSGSSSRLGAKTAKKWGKNVPIPWLFGDCRRYCRRREIQSWAEWTIMLRWWNRGWQNAKRHLQANN